MPQTNTINLDECWLYARYKTKRGYGVKAYGGKLWSAHRLMYTFVIGPIPEGLEIDHLCKVTACINPKHLEAVTPRVNLERSDSPIKENMTKMYCLNGHKLEGKNLEPHKKGWRVCRPCHISRTYKSIAKHKDLAKLRD